MFLSNKCSFSEHKRHPKKKKINSTPNVECYIKLFIRTECNQNKFICCLSVSFFLSLLSLSQWANHQTAGSYRPAICISKRPGGTEENKAGAAILVVSAEARGRGAGEMDLWEGGCCQLYWTRPGPRARRGITSSHTHTHTHTHCQVFWTQRCNIYWHQL